MRARRLLVSVALVVSTLGMPARAGAITTWFVDQRYDIRATLDVAAGRLDGVVNIDLTNRSPWDLDHVHLAAIPRALGYLELDGPVTIDGRSVETTWDTSISLRVPLDRLAPSATTRISVGFGLEVGTSPDAFTARTSRANGVLSFGQWFPIVSTLHDVHGIGDPAITRTARSIRLDLETTTALPRDAVACPGLVAAPAVSGTHWTCQANDVRDFSFVVNPRFWLTRRTVEGTSVRVYTETIDGARTADLAVQALAGLSQAFGEYPWDDLVLAEVGSAGGFSMEYPRMIHLTRGKVDDAYVVYHEVAHQWFYAQLGNDQQREPWLDEALADFSARMLLRIGESQCSTRPVDSTVFDWPAGPTVGGDWTSCDGYFHSVFYRGTEFLNAVRSAMGDTAFFDAMRSWVARNRHGFVTGERFLGYLQSASPTDLRPIFAAYLAHTTPWRPADSAGLRPM